MADPALAAGGATVFPETGSLGEATPTVAPETLVGQEVATFALGLSATGTVVDGRHRAGHRRSPRRSCAARSKPGHQLVAGSVDIEAGRRHRHRPDGQLPGRRPRPSRSPCSIRPSSRRVLGKPVDEAQAILEPYGDVELTSGRIGSGSVPSFESRVDVTVEQRGRDRDAAPSASPGRRDPSAGDRSRRATDRPRASPTATARPARRVRDRSGAAATSRRTPLALRRCHRGAGRRRAGRRPAARGVGRRGPAGRPYARLGRGDRGSTSVSGHVPRRTPDAAISPRTASGR